MKKSVLTLVTMAFLAISSFAQVAINTTGAEPSTSAILDLSSNSKGLLIPRMTTSNRTNNVTAVAGLLVYDTNTDSFWYYDGTQSSWIEVKAGSALDINSLADGKTDESSIFLGSGAGTSDDSNNDNAAVGIDALSNNSSGKFNTAMGSGSLENNTTGSSNTAIGFNSLRDNIAGEKNTSVGSSSLSKNTSGDNNTAVGYVSLYNNTTGENNTAFGKAASYYTTDGKHNTAIGYESSYTNYHGHSNVSIGVASLRKSHNKSNLVAIGDSAMFNNGSGSTNSTESIENTAIGSKAMFTNIKGSKNTAIGYQSLYSNTTGYYNTAIGNEALYSTTTGGRNTAVGISALNSNTTGYNNVVIGDASSSHGTGVSDNVSVGAQSLYWNLTGDQNTVVGYKAGFGSSGTSQSGNVMLGYNAGFYEDGSNKLYITNSNDQTPLIYGEFDNNIIRINGDLDVTGSFTGLEINSLSDAIKSGSYMFMGTDAGINNTGSYNIGVGYEALKLNTTGVRNSAFGYKSLDANIDGNYNSAFGMNSLSANTDGENNTAFGYQSLLNNSTGTNNTAVGFNAGAGSPGISRSGCIYIGSNAGANNTSNNKLFIDNTDTDTPLIGGDLNSNRVDINGTIKITGGTPGSGQVLTSDADGLATWETPTISINDLSDAITSGSNMFMGTSAGLNNSTTYNIGIGFETLKNNSGGRNAAIGYRSLDVNTTGAYNLAFGINGLGNNTEGNGNTAVGADCLSDNILGDANTAVGRESLSGNNVGSGNTAFGYEALLASTSGNYNTAVGYQAYISGTYSNSTAIGAHTSINGSNQIHLGNTSITEIKGQKTFTTYSDGRIKENIKEDVKGLDFIIKLRPVTYNINLDKENQLLGITNQADFPGKYNIEKIKQTGFIAQEVEEAANEVDYNFSGIQKPKHEQDLYGLSYAEFVVPLVKGMQEQQVQIETLKTENAELKARLDRLEKLINQR